MDTQISSKLAALAIALVMNSTIIGSVTCLFYSQPHRQFAVSAANGAQIGYCA